MKLALGSCLGLLLGCLAWGSSWAGVKGDGSPARLGQTPSSPKPGPAGPIPGIGSLAAPLPQESHPFALPPTAPKPGEFSPALSPTGPAAPAQSPPRPAPAPAPGGGGGNEQPPRSPAPSEPDTVVFEKKLASSLRELGVPADKAAKLAREVGASVDKSRYELVELSQIRQDPPLPHGLGQLLARLIEEKAAEAPLNLEAPERGPPPLREQAASPSAGLASGPPTQAQSPSLVQITLEFLKSLGVDTRSDNAPIARDPSAFPRLAARVLSRMADRPRPFNASSATAEIAAAQKAYREQLLETAGPLIKGKAIGSKNLILHGTTLRGLIGMLFTGEMESTSTYFSGRTGARGESLHVWVTKELESGAGYAASKSVAKNLPGVLILLHNPELQLEGESLKRPARVKDDFLAVIITDGERTFVLEKPALIALAASAQLWKKTAIALFRQGQEAEFKIWESFQQALDPHDKSF